MKNYVVHVTYDLGNGEEVTLMDCVAAEDKVEALAKFRGIMNRKGHLEWHPRLEEMTERGLYPELKDINVKEGYVELRIEDCDPPLEKSDFVLEHSRKYADGWIAKDTKHELVITWKERQFNETKEVYFFKNESYSDSARARIMKEIGTWLLNFHDNLL